MTTELLECLEDWGNHFKRQQHPVALTLLRAATVIRKQLADDDSQPNNRPMINSANPSFLITICEALRVHFAVQYGCRNTEWVAYFVAGDCASVKDEFGGCWDIDLTNKQIIPS